MVDICTITAGLLRRQKTMFRLAEAQFGLTQKAIHLDTGMSLSAIGQYARGETAMSGPAIMKLAMWRDFPAELLAVLFAGTKRVVVDENDDGDHARYAAHCIDFTARYAAARHPDSEAGTEIGPTEDGELSAVRSAA